MEDKTAVLVSMPTDLKTRAKQYAGALGVSLNRYITNLIESDLETVPAGEFEFLDRMKERKPAIRAVTDSREPYNIKKK